MVAICMFLSPYLKSVWSATGFFRANCTLSLQSLYAVTGWAKSWPKLRAHLFAQPDMLRFLAKYQILARTELHTIQPSHPGWREGARQVADGLFGVPSGYVKIAIGNDQLQVSCPIENGELPYSYLSLSRWCQIFSELPSCFHRYRMDSSGYNDSIPRKWPGVIFI